MTTFLTTFFCEIKLEIWIFKNTLALLLECFFSMKFFQYESFKNTINIYSSITKLFITPTLF